MKWYKKLYIGESITENAEEIIKDISVNENVKKRFLITLPANKSNMLDIITAKMGIMITWRPVFVVGVAGSRKEAVEMTADLVSEIYEKTSGFDFEEYFNDYI